MHLQCHTPSPNSIGDHDFLTFVRPEVCDIEITYALSIFDWLDNQTLVDMIGHFKFCAV